MSYRPNRPRRPASPRKIQALRLAGWRYSNKRSAWVHRAFNGRVGPVFVDPTDTHPRIDETIVIDHQGPRRSSEEPTPDHVIALEPEAIAPAHAPLDAELLIHVASAPTADGTRAQVPAETADPPEVAAATAGGPHAAAVAAPASDLPRRPLDRHRPELARLPLPPRPLDLSSADPEDIRVHVQLSEFDEPRIVRVDGRPPRPIPSDERTRHDVVVPIRSARAFG